MIRQANIKDVESITALIIQVWLHTYAVEGLNDSISKYVLSEFTIEKIRNDIEIKRYLVSEIDYHIVGVAVINSDATCPVTNENFPELEKLYVQEYFLRKGQGSALLTEVIKYCQKNTWPILWLSVNSANTKAIQFYAKHKFSTVGKMHFQLGSESHENEVLHKEIA